MVNGQKKKDNPIKDKSFAFAIQIVKVYKFLAFEKKEFVMSKQLLRSGTAIGALYREAEHAESKADFIHKMAIAQKECNETLYWLELLLAADYIEKEVFVSLHSDANELISLITSIIRTSKGNGEWGMVNC
ncbi:four helix bundle protein [Lentimicrobium sp.]